MNTLLVYKSECSYIPTLIGVIVFTEGCRKISSFKRSHDMCCVPVCRQIII